jgi:hypothetical protein
MKQETGGVNWRIENDGEDAEARWRDSAWRKEVT